MEKAGLNTDDAGGEEDNRNEKEKVNNASLVFVVHWLSIRCGCPFVNYLMDS